GRKTVKSSKDAEGDNLDAETMDYTFAQDKENRTKDSTDRQEKGTAELKDESPRESTTPTAPPTTPTAPTTTLTPTPTVFADDETIAYVLLIMSQNKEKLKEKEKGVELKDVKGIERPRPTSTRSVLTLKPLPKIDPKPKGKGVIEEEDGSDFESEGITEAEKKFKILTSDEEIVRKVQEEWEAKEEKKRLDEQEAT
ncbi:hypothetical protein Tco_1379973, partial [Tanacetum coccineum]